MRVRGNSIRLRLTQSEVSQFAETGLVEEIIEFGGERNLTYQLKHSPDAETVKAEFDSDRIRVIIPQMDAKTWANSEQEGIRGEHELGGGKVLSLLIEKDFACLEPRKGEEDVDTFPHPLTNRKC